ncbi:MAG: hypothetical protein IMY86_14015 [Chloroflexi bacterium]|nr:hypothetical protein [Chloroflexota bacterium]
MGPERLHLSGDLTMGLAEDLPMVGKILAMHARDAAKERDCDWPASLRALVIAYDPVLKMLKYEARFAFRDPAEAKHD